MALRYVVKKTVFGFDKQKTEKFVAKNVITNTVDFQTLCEEITKVGLVPSGVVKFVLDALIDTLNINLRKGISVQLGDFGCFRPGIKSRSQEVAEKVDSTTIQRVKIIFTPGNKFRSMLRTVGVEKQTEGQKKTVTPAPSGGKPGPDTGGGGAPDPSL